MPLSLYFFRTLAVPQLVFGPDLSSPFILLILCHSIFTFSWTLAVPQLVFGPDPSSPFIPFDLLPISLYYFSGLWLYLNWSLDPAPSSPFILLISCHSLFTFFRTLAVPQLVCSPAPSSPFIPIDLVPLTLYFFQDS